MACVLGGMDLVSPLGRAGIRSTVAAAPGNPARWSRHVAEVVPALDPFAQAEAFVDALVTWAARQETPPVLYYGTDAELLMVSRHREKLAQSFRLVLADAALVEDCVDKSRFAVRAKAAGLHVPASAVYSLDGVDLRFPVVVKPVRHGQGDADPPFQGKAAHVRTPTELRDFARAIPEPLLVQELVPGAESRVESWHGYVDDDKRVVAEFTGAKIRTYPLTYGESTWVRITDAADVRTEGRRAVAALGLTGVCKIDFKRALDGTLWLLEVNARFIPVAQSRRRSGRQSACNRPLSTQRTAPAH